MYWSNCVLHFHTVNSRPLNTEVCQHKARFTCRETCQGQEWGLASLPDTILSAMLGLKWAIPQSLGQSERRKNKIKPPKQRADTQINVFKYILTGELWVCVRFCVFALTQVEELVLRLASRGECVCSCRQRRLAQQQRQQQRQKEEQRRSRYSHRLSQNHRPAHVPRYLYQAASTRRCTYTGTHTVLYTHTHTLTHQAGTMSCDTTKAERWIVLL